MEASFVELKERVLPFAKANNFRASLELFLAISGYLISLIGLYVFYTHSFWFAYGATIILVGLFAVKTFTIQHDCGHGSFFSSPQGNLWAGRLCSLFMTMPFSAWKTSHNIHHTHVGDIEKIGEGDVILLTVEQYKSLTVRDRFVYRIRRHPLFQIIFAPFIYFFLMSKIYNAGLPQYTKSTMLTNIVTLSLFGVSVWLFGFWTSVFVLMPPMYVGGIIGVCLFYLQHNFPHAQWYRSAGWSRERASAESCSVIILPQPLDWFTHSIGYHHIHHLNSGVPGYALRACYRAVASTQSGQVLTIADVMSAFTLKLWSYEKDALVSFSEAVNITK